MKRLLSTLSSALLLLWKRPTPPRLSDIPYCGVGCPDPLFLAAINSSPYLHGDDLYLIHHLCCCEECLAYFEELPHYGLNPKSHLQDYLHEYLKERTNQLIRQFAWDEIRAIHLERILENLQEVKDGEIRQALKQLSIDTLFNHPASQDFWDDHSYGLDAGFLQELGLEKEAHSKGHNLWLTASLRDHPRGRAIWRILLNYS